ncbi:MAG: glycine dehydrogenase, partial [Thermoleophilia bacterium]|nr:glycine dehydrogenase [Thermoleophilia bacterium]
MPYTIHTDEERRRMLDAIGVSSIKELFRTIPAALADPPLDLPPGLSEPELRRHVESLAATNRPAHSRSFLGAGCYRHHVPAIVRSLAGRAEFATAYTPYQAEISQGTLQHIFEFQSLICGLTGLDVANASLYDGPSALAEAALMAVRLTKRETILFSSGIHPEAIQVLRTYAAGPELPLVEIPLDSHSGRTVASALPSQPASGEAAAAPAAVLVQQPNFFGVLEDLHALAEAARSLGALLVVMQNPLTLGLLAPPGELGAD